MEKRKVAIITGTRAEWGLLSGIARALRERDDVTLQIVVTNMHLMPRYGNTVDEIVADGFAIDARVPMDVPDDSDVGKVVAMSRCMAGMADAFARLQPDMVVILGDRYEMLATASAALMMHIPIAHIAGGEISEGAVDDSIRHAITKMSALHLTATEPYRRRVIQMGEDPSRVINTGAIGVYNIAHEPVMSLDELNRSIGFTIDADTLLVTYHPATLDAGDVASRCRNLLDALDRFPGNKVLITYPNNDSRGAVIIDMIEEYARCNPERVKVVPSLGKRRYLSALHYVAAVVGNSSSGIVEVPSMHIPTVNIGIRQQGRLASQSVIHCGDSAGEIAFAISEALSPCCKGIAAKAPNPYYKDNTLALIVDAIATAPLDELKIKKFYNLPQDEE